MNKLAIRPSVPVRAKPRITASLSRKWARSPRHPVVSGDYTIVTLPDCYLLLHRSMPLGRYDLQGTAKMAAERHGAGYSFEFTAGGWK